MNKEYFVDKELYDNLSASFSALEIENEKLKQIISEQQEMIEIYENQLLCLKDPSE